MENKYELNLNVDEFWDRIKELTKNKQTTKLQFCNDLGFHFNTFCNKVTQKVYPTLKELLLLAKYFNVSVEYLIFGKTYAEPSQALILLNEYKIELERFKNEQNQKLNELKQNCSNILETI